MENDSDAIPRPSESSNPSQKTASSAQNTPQIPRGTPVAMYTPQQNAFSRPSQSHNYYPRPPEFPARNEYHPSTAFGHPPAHFPPPNGFPPTARPWQRTPRRQEDNIRSSPIRKTSQIADVTKVNISNGHFPILTDTSPAEGEFSIITRAGEVDISGGQFVIGETTQVSAFIKNTADVAERAFGKGNARNRLEEDDIR